MSSVRTSALALFLFVAVFAGSSYSHAQTTDEAAAARISQADAASRAAAESAAKAAAEVQAQIDSTNAEIKRLREEIAQLQGQLTTTAAQRQTLQTAIKQLDLQIQTLQKSLTLTTKEISTKDKEISRLASTIGETNEKIDETEQGVADSLRQLQQMDSLSPATAIFGGATLSDFFDEAVTLSALRGELQNRIEDLGTLRSQLQSNKSTAETKRQELDRLKKNLNTQKQGVAAARSDQTVLLTQTKNKESEYQRLIAEKQAEEAKFEAELSKFEASLGLSVSAGSIPASRAGTLQWPLDTVRITQYFGNTSFATQNPQIYGNKGHNAIDMAAPSGTKVKAALGGTVLGTGNTDATCPNASYGKWVFIKHPNGLSTLYAHLSVISVSSGEEVETGDTVGLSGNTGYSTGPHLHFGVYATSGSKVSSFPSSSCRGKTYTMPVADVTAYLNPLSYLPAR